MEAPEPPLSSAEMKEMESPVASETSLRVLCARVRSLRSCSPGPDDSRSPPRLSSRHASTTPSCLRIAAKFSPSTFLSCLILRSRATSVSV
jgi:hypothetical protein